MAAGTGRSGSAARGEVPAAAPDAGSPGSASSSPPREVALQVVHMRSLPLGVSHPNLALGLDSERRLDALEWLVQAFDALGLPDSQLFAAFGLLDRYAAASPVPISVGQGAFALVLASMLIALKVNGTQRDLERAKRLVVEVSGSSKPWAAVRRAELSILRRLGFRACTPTTRDLLDRILGDALHTQAFLPDGAWDTKACNRCLDLARFLLELGLVQDAEAVFGPGRPPLTAAAAAALLSMRALGAPRTVVEALHEALRLLDPSGGGLAGVAEAMRRRWVEEENRAAAGTRRAVAEKWFSRVGPFGANPPTAGELRQFVGATIVAAAPEVAKQEPARGSPAVPQRRLSLVGEVLAAIPTPARRLSMGEAPTGVLHSSTASATAQLRMHKAAAREVLRSERAERAELPLTPRRCEAPPRPEPSAAPERGGKAIAAVPAAAEDHGHAALAGAGLRGACMQENLSTWPSDIEAMSPTAAAMKGALHAARGAAATSSAAHPEPLVELTHVLNMVAPRAQQGAAGVKQRPPSVATVLLVSSALRMQWPMDRRKVGATDAASTCKEAAAVLQEAASQLLGAAEKLESGLLGAREFRPLAVGSESKRRRTFGGPSPPRAASPGAPPTHRGSPPLGRFAGLRV